MMHNFLVMFLYWGKWTVSARFILHLTKTNQTATGEVTTERAVWNWCQKQRKDLFQRKETFAILISSTKCFVQFPAIEQNVCFILQPELLPPAGCY